MRWDLYKFTMNVDAQITDNNYFTDNQCCLDNTFIFMDLYRSADAIHNRQRKLGLGLY
jgi:hypothetical protein